LAFFYYLLYYTAFNNYVPKEGIAALVVVEKNVGITERFFNNHYIGILQMQITSKDKPALQTAGKAQSA